MQDELLFSLFQVGKSVLLQKTDNVYAKPYVESIMRVIYADADGVLAHLARRDNEVRPVLFVPFDGTTSFAFVSPGFSQFDEVVPSTPVIDLGSNLPTTMGDLYPTYFAPKAAPAPIAIVPVVGSPAPASMTTPVVEAEPEWLRQFQVGTVVNVVSTSHPGLGRYIGQVLQISHSDVKGMLGLPERSSGLTEAIYIPFDGETELGWPRGTFSFASGLASGQRVYNPATTTYTYVEEFCPAYNYVYAPAPVIYYDTFVPFGVVYDPYYRDPFWPYW